MPETVEKKRGVTWVTIGPRGGNYVNPSGNKLGYRIFRIQVNNDSIRPVDLDIHFSNDSTPLLPESNGFVKALLIPHSIAPDKPDEYDFGITGLNPFLDSASTKPTKLQTTVQPNTKFVFYVGVLLYQTDGVTRASMTTTRNNLVFTIHVSNSSTASAAIECGEINQHPNSRE